MASRTIGVELARGRAIRLVVGILALRVLVLMVAEMRGRHLVFVLTIDGSHRPGSLERQDHQQENEEEFFHGPNNNKIPVSA